MATNPPLGWSELFPDVLSLIYKRLSFSDFARAKTVCSSWTRTGSYFNPEEGKYYKTLINNLGFENCRSLATSGNWILVYDKEPNLHIINPFTLEVFHLPPLRTHYTSEYKNIDNYYDFRQRHPKVDNAVLWVDERSKDYLVVWTSRGRDRLSFCWKGYEEWFATPMFESLEDKDEDCVDLAYNYKDKKLYILSHYGSIMILDFSQAFPRIDPNNPYKNQRSVKSRMTRLKLTTSGDVLMVRSLRCSLENIWFEVYKMNSTNEDWKRVMSLDEEEALAWDLSVTLPTKGVSGIKKDSIYFCDHDFISSVMKAATYEISTQRTNEQCSNLGGVDHARWFLPCFAVGEK